MDRVGYVDMRAEDAGGGDAVVFWTVVAEANFWDGGVGVEASCFDESDFEGVEV